MGGHLGIRPRQHFEVAQKQPVRRGCLHRDSNSETCDIAAKFGRSGRPGPRLHPRRLARSDRRPQAAVLTHFRRMASCGDSQNGGRYPARFDSGSTSGFSAIPSTSAMNARRDSTRSHIPGYREASSARKEASASATPSSMFEVWYTEPVAGMMSSCSAIPDSKETEEPAY